jgi:hypothetical protein
MKRLFDPKPSLRMQRQIRLFQQQQQQQQQPFALDFSWTRKGMRFSSLRKDKMKKKTLPGGQSQRKAF